MYKILVIEKVIQPILKILSLTRSYFYGHYIFLLSCVFSRKLLHSLLFL